MHNKFWLGTCTQRTLYPCSYSLTAATKTRTKRTNQEAVIGMCFAIIIKHRNPTLNLLQKIISLVLYSGHSSKQVSFLLTGNSAPIIIVFVLVQVYHRLQPLNITVSYSSLLRLLKKVGENHDALVNTWKVAIVESMKNLEVCSYNHRITKVNLSHY